MTESRGIAPPVNTMNIVWDTEVFPNCFLLCADTGTSKVSFEISAYRNDLPALQYWMNSLIPLGRMVGFNNIGFDYPVLHFILTGGITDPGKIYDYAMAVIGSESKFAHIVRPSERRVPQLDLFRIHHFDNKARTTSLKNLEFNMRLWSVADLPFPVGKVLTKEEVEVLRNYCFDDVEATRQFLIASTEQVKLRDDLSKQYSYDFTNHSDVKLGKDIFQLALEKAGVSLYVYGPNGRDPKQTPRSSIALRVCIPHFIGFDTAEFRKVLHAMDETVITGTKGTFDLSATVGGIEFFFGTGGIHASVDPGAFESDDEFVIYDVDVTGMYPAIAMSQGYYPEHLGPAFVQVYKGLRDLRAQYPKGSPQNAAYKLAMNGVYGASNDRFSVFYDPLFTMKITIGGQLMIAMLAEALLSVDGLRIIQANTDGLTVKTRRTDMPKVNELCTVWSRITGLELESVEYSKMFIRDVNNYIAVTESGKVKRKGAFEYDIEWHQDGSALVVKKAAEKVLLEGASPYNTVANWPDIHDFMLRARVGSNCYLLWEKDGRRTTLPRTQRYYMSKSGGSLVKIMPPLPKAPDKWREIGIQSGHKVMLCNRMDEYRGLIDLDWYVKQVNKLTLGVM